MDKRSIVEEVFMGKKTSCGYLPCGKKIVHGENSIVCYDRKGKMVSRFCSHDCRENKGSEIYDARN